MKILNFHFHFTFLYEPHLPFAERVLSGLTAPLRRSNRAAPALLKWFMYAPLGGAPFNVFAIGDTGGFFESFSIFFPRRSFDLKINIEM